MSVGPVPKIPIGIKPPMVLPVPLSSLPVLQGGVDLTTLTGIQYRVWRPDGTELPTRWMGAILGGATPTSAATQYPFTGSDFDQVGVWELAPVGLVPAGEIAFDSVQIDVVRIPGGP